MQESRSLLHFYIGLHTGGRMSHTLKIVAALLIVWLLMLVSQQSAFAQELVSNAQIFLTGKDDEQFPTIVMTMSVVSGRGLPITGLGRDDVEIIETPQQWGNPSILELSPIGQQPRQILFLLDRSVKRIENWQAIQSMVGNVIQNMTPSDRVALMVFGDDAQLIHPYSNDKNSLQSALYATLPDGRNSALDIGIVRAIQEVSQVNQLDRHIIVIADGLDNTQFADSATQDTNAQNNTQSLEETVVQIGLFRQISNANIHLLLYRERTQSLIEPQNYVSLIGATANVVDSVDQLAPLLQERFAMLGQGYRLSYYSQHPRDGAEFGATVKVNALNAASVEPLRLRAKPKLVRFDIADNTTISLTTFLGISMLDPTQIISLTFKVDGQNIVSIPQAIQGILLDASTLGEGPHLFTVEAINSTNLTDVDTRVLQVVNPLSWHFVEADPAFPPASVISGDPLSLTLVITSHYSGLEYQVLLDGRAESDVTLPIAIGRSSQLITVATSALTTGIHTLTLQLAKSQTIFAPKPDRLSLAFNVQSVPLPTRVQNWWQRLQAQVMANSWWWLPLLLGLFLLWLLRQLWIWYCNRPKPIPIVQPLFQMAIQNQGNVGSRYLLSGEGEKQDLLVLFGINGGAIQLPLGAWERLTKPDTVVVTQHRQLQLNWGGSAVQNGIGALGLVNGATQHNGNSHNSNGHNGSGSNGTGQNGYGHNRASQNGTYQNGGGKNGTSQQPIFIDHSTLTQAKALNTDKLVGRSVVATSSTLGDVRMISSVLPSGAARSIGAITRPIQQGMGLVTRFQSQFKRIGQAAEVAKKFVPFAGGAMASVTTALPNNGQNGDAPAIAQNNQPATPAVGTRVKPAAQEQSSIYETIRSSIFFDSEGRVINDPIETPALQPGESLKIDVYVEPVKRSWLRRKTQLTLYSQSIESQHADRTNATFEITLPGRLPW